MGLEGVEIVMEAEKAFAIEITNPEAARLRVVEDLHLLVMTKLAHSQPDPTAVWTKVVDIVHEATYTPREHIKPGSKWSEIGVR